MSNKPLIPESKLPSLGTTIFTQMSALAQEHRAINLSQGFPDFDGPRYLQERLAYHVAQGANQYAPMTGVPALREAIADKTAELYGHRPDANSDITVTAGRPKRSTRRSPRWYAPATRSSVLTPATTATRRP
ncbi:Methionine aminotransferase [Raoultella planticola]|nr:Methionine aminotransferase [Raoultella planticola]